MLTLILRRLLLVLPNLFLLTFLLFASITTLLGSPAAMMLGEEASPEAIRELNERFGFDRPVPVQYADWIWNALQGNFGRSFTTQQAVADAVLPRVPVTLELALWSIALAVLVATTINTIPVDVSCLERPLLRDACDVLIGPPPPRSWLRSPGAAPSPPRNRGAARRRGGRRA